MSRRLRPSGPGLAGLIATGGMVLCFGTMAGVLMVGVSIGRDTERMHWENKIVDDPDRVAAIRSAVIFERAARKARGETSE